MKIGIITTFRQANFGSVLQAFSLQFVLEKMGYDVELIDYKYPNGYHYQNGYPKKSFWITGKYKLRLFLGRIGLKAKNKMLLMNDFISQNTICTKTYNSKIQLQSNPPIFDVYISGSDQIWNPNTMFGDMSYFLDFAPKNARKIAYSSSFSCDTIPQKYKQRYKYFLQQYKSIFVREENGRRIAKVLTGRTDIEVVLDPTLLLNSNEWSKYAEKSSLSDIPQNYILFYMLAYTYNPQNKMTEILSEFQNQYKLPILSLSEKPIGFHGEFIQIEKEHTIGIYEFLDLFCNATIVVTSSFHGTAFALNFGKPLLALIDGEKKSDDRISTIMEKMGVNKQLIDTNTIIDDKINPFYDIEREQNMLERERNRCLSLLKESIEL